MSIAEKEGFFFFVFFLFKCFSNVNVIRAFLIKVGINLLKPVADCENEQSIVAVFRAARKI